MKRPEAVLSVAILIPPATSLGETSPTCSTAWKAVITPITEPSSPATTANPPQNRTPSMNTLVFRLAQAPGLYTWTVE